MKRLIIIFYSLLFFFKVSAQSNFEQDSTIWTFKVQAVFDSPSLEYANPSITRTLKCRVIESDFRDRSDIVFVFLKGDLPEYVGLNKTFNVKGYVRSLWTIVMGLWGPKMGTSLYLTPVRLRPVFL